MQKAFLIDDANNAVEFYNQIAEEYNRHLQSDTSNAIVRRRVAAYFFEVVKGKTILDFGGGTGLDLPWLIKNNYQVFFCEPSTKMRAMAIDFNKQLENSNAIFLNDIQANFLNWDENAFSKPLDGVLANFAVLNNIDNLNIFFQKLDLVIKPGGHLMATMLDTTLRGIWSYYLRNFIGAGLKNSKAVLITVHEGYRHCSYLHTPLNVIDAAIQFKLIKKERIHGTGFMLLHLQRC